MRRWVALGFLGVLLAGGAGYLVSASADAPGSIGPGRVRESRGRVGREGPVRSGGSNCTPASGAALDGTWNVALSDPTLPTYTLNAGTSPDCTGNAARLQMPATSDTAFATLRSAAGVCVNDNGGNTVKCWVRGRAGSSGTTRLGVQQDNFTWQAQAISFTGTWTYFKKFFSGNRGTANNAGAVVIGNSGGLLVPTEANSAADIELFDCTCVTGDAT